jgi:hypothetical protein
MVKSSNEVPGRWNHQKRDLGVILWISFLAACVGTFVLFALLDPAALNEGWEMSWEMSRKLAYSLGFLFLLLIALLASSLTVFMIRSGPRTGHVHGKGRRAAPQVDTHAAEDPQLELDPGEWREP